MYLNRCNVRATDHRTKLRDSVSRKRDGNIKLHVSVMFPLGGKAKSSF